MEKSKIALKHKSSRSGFSLLEILIAMALLIILTVGALPLLNSSNSIEAKEAAEELATLLRQAHDDAMFRHLTIRIVFEMDEDTSRYFAQSTSAKALLMKEVNENELSRKELEMLEEKAKERSSLFKNDSLLAEKKELPGGVKIQWIINGVNQQFDQGIAFLHFFASGKSEAGKVRIVDNDLNAYLIEINPITGRVKVEPTLYEEKK